MDDYLFKVTGTAIGIGMIGLLIATVMFSIERGSPGQEWVAIVGAVSTLTAFFGVIMGFVTTMIAVWRS